MKLWLSSSGALALCLLPSLFTASAIVHASEPEPEKEAVHLEYVATGRCPERSWILAELAARTDTWRLAEPKTRARRFVLRIDRQGGSYTGRLDIHSPSGDVFAGSTIRGPDCEDVALGLTVAIALALDPRAGASEAPPIPSTPPILDEEARAAPATAPDAKPTRSLSPGPPAERHATDETEPLLSSPRLGLGARIEGSHGVAGLLAGASLFGELSWRGRVPWFSPKVRLGVRRTLPGRVEVADGHVDMTLSTALVELCPVVLAVGSHAEASGCIQGSIGVLTAAAKDVPSATTEDRIWLDYGALGALRWWLGEHLALEACFGVDVPVTRHRILVETHGLVSRADPLVFVAGAGVIHRF